MENLCENLRRYCNSVRNEVFRYLTTLESIRVSTAQHILEMLPAYLNAIAVMITCVLAYSAYRESNITFIIMFTSVMIILLFMFNKFTRKSYQMVLRAVRSIDNLVKFNKEGLRMYVEKLNDYCTELCDAGCVEDADILCLDIEKLNELVGKLEEENSK